ncbi:hypothetical protein SAMN04487936_10865 [Halobacillus dabanensis]|uniref:Uncharacterized protein n=1 Tax=Halobacillus dabanensis TaxID=240302 RepID=A0A1I3XAG3_HALDA|nr:hypothetical protein [Halobacillus dabanensis]SFK15916.1 hypothetical protein SAMN04487936_10865 [Halobacillus dabanensis]
MKALLLKLLVAFFAVSLLGACAGEEEPAEEENNTEEQENTGEQDQMDEGNPDEGNGETNENKEEKEQDDMTDGENGENGGNGDGMTDDGATEDEEGNQ